MVTDEDFDFSELALAFTGRVPDAGERVRQALAPLRILGLVEAPQYMDRTTVVSVILSGFEGDTVEIVDAHGNVETRPLRQVVDGGLVAGLRPEVAFLNDECVYGTPVPGGDRQEPAPSWAVFAGPGLRAEHLVIASAKDKSARWRYWEEGGCGLAHYSGERRYHLFAFPAEAGTVLELLPDGQDLDATLFAERRRLDMVFSEGAAPITGFPEGSAAALRLAALCAEWSGFTRETFDELAELTGNPRAAAALERTLRHGTARQALGELLGNVGIGRGALDYALQGNVPDTARSIEPRGTLERVKVVRAEVAARTGTRPSFFAALKRLRTAT